ncbi:unnamed protein product [Durusdinium trenchii]|uniref:Uncharacterized protein n=2 Tax=Durusdinium trenchii TaxID=1381693 RepID=A0ABP0K7U9_9DINO
MIQHLFEKGSPKTWTEPAVDARSGPSFVFFVQSFELPRPVVHSRRDGRRHRSLLGDRDLLMLQTFACGVLVRSGLVALSLPTRLSVLHHCQGGAKAVERAGGSGLMIWMFLDDLDTSWHQEEQDDMELRQATHTRTTTSFDVVETHLDSSYSIWERHLGVPHPWITYAFPAWWSMVVAPALLLAVAVAAFHHSNALLFSQALAFSDLSWLPTTAMSAWPYHWCIIKAVCAGITDAFHGLFVEAPLRILTAPRQTWNSFWGFADTSSDFLNLFAVDHPHGELVAGQFEGNFRIFRSTVLLLRLILTMLFACLRLTAVIARTPDEREESESDSAWEEVEEEFCGA